MFKCHVQNNHSDSFNLSHEKVFCQFPAGFIIILKLSKTFKKLGSLLWEGTKKKSQKPSQAISSRMHINCNNKDLGFQNGLENFKQHGKLSGFQMCFRSSCLLIIHPQFIDQPNISTRFIHLTSFQPGNTLHPRGYVACFRDIFDGPNRGQRMLLSLSRQKSGMLASMLQGTNQPLTSRTHPAQNAVLPRLTNPDVSAL